VSVTKFTKGDKFHGISLLSVVGQIPIKSSSIVYNSCQWGDHLISNTMRLLTVTCVTM